MNKCILIKKIKNLPILLKRTVLPKTHANFTALSLKSENSFNNLISIKIFNKYPYTFLQSFVILKFN